ncbi:aldehyde dehydrogenase (NADP(+)) [Flavisolibacter ginsenosidimutans]|uniref:Aldehyde dehydrogenase (NADP(+)) n=2 Tax=Flavisolibacter ginsenosidimutans TaxID=661481 RepID=A0A5B8UP97_9BACT|nr:aldehyde dehydrogenase (NADP(+)) [Flavisolibacter ginsenosidimutans]
MKYVDATVEEVNEALLQSAKAFQLYGKRSLKERANFLYAVAEEMKNISSELLSIAQKETHLDEARLKVELNRTLFQLTSYADACAEGTWLDLRIDTGDKARNSPKPDLRKMLVPLGPVVVFGASNFPFAYSTAGGDTACALAAGCSVIIKAHPAHAGTSERVAAAVQKTAKKQGLPEGIFLHLHGAGFEVGKALIQHPLTKAVGFTGSFEGGKALFDLAAQRNEPIPVFAEMGSVNPVFLLPQKLANETGKLASMLAASITQSVGQFCTNPGILVGVKSKVLDEFKEFLGEQIKQTSPTSMLHPGIAKSFQKNRAKAIEEGAVVVATNEADVEEDESIPTLAEVPAEQFLQNTLLHKEVFGPYSLLVECATKEEMLEVAKAIEGQLTCTLMATDEEANKNSELIDALKEKCGRFVFNGVPTGVEVALSMQHGGPYPATTDSRFTAVGADGIKRFARPLCFQNWNNDLLPDELKNENPLGLWRTVNNVLSKDPVNAD